MASSKPKKLGTWTHEKSGITVDYFINGTRFECTVLEENLHAPEAAVLRAKVMDKLEHWMEMRWFPIIQVEISTNSHSYRNDPDGIEVSCKSRRFYLSRSPAGQVMSVDWDVDELHRKAKMSKYGSSEIALTRLPLGAPFQQSGRYGNDSGYLIDYTDESWQALEAIKTGLHEMAKKLVALVRNREGLKRLQSGGGKLMLTQGGGK